jgi:DNA-binding LytR/AlgR family response regulator
MISCAIIEDDSISRTMVEGLAEKTNLLSVVGSFASAQEAMPWLNKNKVDLLFLDIEMPGISGIDLLKVLAHKPEVIIISSNPEYAIDAFEFSVADYLLKPVKDYSRFLHAVNKVASRLSKTNTDSDGDDHLFVKIDSLLHKLSMEDILWIEAFGDYVKIQAKDKLHTVYSTLKKIEEKLPSDKFLRVHRSFIINLEKISNIDSSNLEIDKKIIPISENYKEQLLNKIKIL